MKKNKFVKIIEHILVALPLLYVGSLSTYAIFNDNAKDSYGNDYLYKEYAITNVNDYDINFIYTFDANGTSHAGGITNIFDLTYLSYSSSDLNITESERDSIVKWRLRNGVVDFMTSDSVVVTSFTFSSLPNNNTFLASGGIDFRWFNVFDITRQVYKSRTLDTFFTYGMSEFNKLGFNKIPFTSFFINIFHNGETNVYIDFVNNYLNYMLFVECCYFVPMILYWFIHFGEDVIDRFTRKGDRL